MLISRLPNPNILQQSEPNGLKLWIITVNWGIKMLDFCQILKWPVSKSYWKLVLFFENNDIFSFILYLPSCVKCWSWPLKMCRYSDIYSSGHSLPHQSWPKVLRVGAPPWCLEAGHTRLLHSWCLVMVTQAGAGAGAGGGHLAPELIPA